MSQHRRAIIALLAVLACTNRGMLFGVPRDAAFERQWQVALGAIDDALWLGDTAGAVARWREAYGLAIRSGGWSQLADIGDAALRMGDASTLQPSAAGAARQSYLTAMYRARAERSAEGIRRVCEAFVLLGDQDVAEQCSRLVAQLTAS
jgi:hypothetical protein